MLIDFGLLLRRPLHYNQFLKGIGRPGEYCLLIEKDSIHEPFKFLEVNIALFVFIALFNDLSHLLESLIILVGAHYFKQILNGNAVARQQVHRGAFFEHLPILILPGLLATQLLLEQLLELEHALFAYLVLGPAEALDEVFELIELNMAVLIIIELADGLNDPDGV